jgi:hypothetical protein
MLCMVFSGQIPFNKISSFVGSCSDVLLVEQDGGVAMRLWLMIKR